MDYSKYKKIEFRRKFWKFLGVNISIYDPATDNLIGFINQKTIMLKPDVFVYTDKTMQKSVVELKKQTVMKVSPKYSIIDTQTQSEFASMQFNDIKSYYARWYINIYDKTGNSYGYVQETSGFLAILRRWLSIFNDTIALIFMFVPQTFNIYYSPNGTNPQLVGKIIHRKNPVIVKMGLDLTEGQVNIDPKINLAICTLLCLRDIYKNA
jgi:hypothetical protein